MRPRLLEIVVTFPVALLMIAATVAWSIVVLRRSGIRQLGPALRRALESVITFGSKGSTEKADISVPGSLGTVALALLVYGLVREPVHLPIFGYAAMVFCGFTATSFFGWRSGPRLGVEPGMAIKVAFLCAFFGIIGARLFFVAQFWEQDFADQPAGVTFGVLTPAKGEELEGRTALGAAKVVFTGDEKTPSQVKDRIDPAFRPIGAHARLITVERRDQDVWSVRHIERGFVVETDARGPSAEIVLNGTALHQPAIGARGVSVPWTDMFAIWKGGLVYYGGMIFGSLAVFVFVRLQGNRVAQVADLASSVGALGVAFGRAGCFLNGCCWGRRAELPWSIRFPLYSPAWFQHTKSLLGADWDPLIDERQLTAAGQLPARLAEALVQHGAEPLCQASWPLHPTELYALLLDLGMFAIIYPFALYKAKREWQTFALWFIIYGVVRFVIEHFRGDHEGFTVVLGYPLTPSQKVAVLTMPFAIAGFVWATRKGRVIVPWKPPTAS